MMSANPDPFRTLKRLIDPDRPAVVLDVGANEGVLARRFAEAFPTARVHAFEPAPGPLARLRTLAAECPGIVPVGVAAGAASGHTDFYVCEDHLMSSVLAPGDQIAYRYGDAARARDRIRVEVVTLDDYARAAGLGRVDVLKLDVQGLELDVLRGAEGLLRAGVSAVLAEAQIATDYRGAANLTAISGYLESLGYGLFQFARVYQLGWEDRTAAVDGLWLHRRWLERAHLLTDRLFELDWADRVGQRLADAAELGFPRVALYGAGYHTQAVLSRLGERAASVVAVVDDRVELAGTRLAGREVVTPVAACALARAGGLDAVVLSSNRHEQRLWDASADLRAAGVPVLRVYDDSPTPGLSARRAGLAPAA